MAITPERRPDSVAEPRPLSLETISFETRPGALEQAALPVSPPGWQDHPPSQPAEPRSGWQRWRKRVLLGGGALVGLGLAAWLIGPWLVTMLNTVSTDDAYVNGHVTFLAPRVAGQVMTVLVDDNYRVKRGDILVQLDKEPYQVQVNIKKAAVQLAEADLVAAEAQVRAQVAQARANRFKLEHAIEDVNTQIANLRAAVATLNSKKASLDLARANLKRGEELAPTGGISKEELDVRRQTVKVAQAAVDQALQQVYAIRVGLGLPAQPEKGHELTEVPFDLEQNYSAVLQALGDLLQSTAQFGYFPTTWTGTPKQTIAEFYKQDPEEAAILVSAVAQAGGLPGLWQVGWTAESRINSENKLNRILARIIPQAPAIKQAEAKLVQARRDLDQAELNLRYCDVVSEIDGVVTRRNVNPGNNVAVGQNLMAIRSLTEIWIDANLKETQLADLRIGQRVRIEVDMYGSQREFEGRITGFTMGTGQTLALLPPQNATGNFVKIVQRLPVRVDLVNYNPDDYPLFVGLSCTPYVYYKEPPTGPNAGKFLQPFYPLPKAPAIRALTVVSAIGQCSGQPNPWQVGSLTEAMIEATKPKP